MCEAISGTEARELITRRKAELVTLQGSGKGSLLQPGDQVMKDSELAGMSTSQDPAGGSYL